MNLADIQFDHDSNYVKRREFGKGVTYEQDGILFSSGFVPLKILREKRKKDKFDGMTPDELRHELRTGGGTESTKQKVSSDKASVRERADDKLAGFKTEDQPDFVQKAMSEDHAALAAEEKAE